MKKGDDVAEDDNDDVVRTSVSKDRATATLYTEELFLSTQYLQYTVALSAYQKVQPWGGGRIQTVNVTLLTPAGFHASQPELTAGYKVSYKTGFFCTIVLWLGKTTKPFFLFPAERSLIFEQRPLGILVFLVYSTTIMYGLYLVIVLYKKTPHSRLLALTLDNNPI